MKKNKNIEKKVLSRCYRYFLFFIMISLDGTLDISNGIFSSASKEIIKRLNINNLKFGSFSTATSAGKIISSSLFILLNQRISRKWLIVLCIILHSIFLFCFKITENANIIIIIFLLLGITKNIVTIYIPVWINQYGRSEYKTVQITTTQFFQSMGKITGNLFNYLLGYENWQNNLVISGIILLILSFCCIISNENYFSRTLFPKSPEQDKKIKRISSTFFEENDINNKYDNKNKNINFFSEISILFNNQLYIICLICGSIIRGLITCLNYWFPDFLRNIAEKQYLKMTIAYTIISLVGPFGGVIANAILIPIIGNYESRKASWPIVFLQLMSSIFAINIGLMKSLISVCIITIFYFIFNYSAHALIQGILISCVDKKLSATGYAFANACMQIIIGPTPIIYGIINDKFKDIYPWLPMCSIMSINLLAIPLLIYLAMLRNKKFDEEEKMKENKNQEELIDK